MAATRPLTPEQDAVLRSTLGTTAMEGQPLTDDERAALTDFVAGKITRERYLARVLPTKYRLSD